MSLNLLARFPHFLSLLLAWSVLLHPASAQTFLEQTKLVGSDVSPGDQLGRSLAFEGDTAVAGAPATTGYPPGYTGPGAAYVFVRSGTAWTQQAKLVAGDPLARGVGWSVALSGDTVLVGAPLTSLPGPYLTTAGEAFVFVRNGNTWTEQARLISGLPQFHERFGASVALMGDTALVGAPTLGDFGTVGAVYVFVRNGTTWTLQARLVASDGDTGDFFGVCVALSGGTALVGAPLDDHSGLVDTGSAYIFERSGTSWSEQAKLLASDGRALDEFGCGVSLSADTAMLGAAFHEHSGTPREGAAYVLVRTGALWTEQAELHASGYTLFGIGLALSNSGDTALVGCASDTDPRGYPVFLLARNGTTWSEQGQLRASDPSIGDQFGWTLALSGDTILVGASQDAHCTGQQGSVYVFGPVAGPLHPDITAVEPEYIPPLIPGTAQTIRLTGRDFDRVTELLLACIPIDPARYTIVSPNLITLDMPQSPGPGAQISVTDGDYADLVGLYVYEPRTPIYQLGNGDPLNVVDRDGGLSFILSGPVGSVQYVLVSPSDVPSSNPYVNLDLGNNFTQLWIGPRYVIPPQGWVEVTIPAANLPDPGPAGRIFYSQTLLYRYAVGYVSHPFPVSNLQSMQFVQ